LLSVAPDRVINYGVEVTSFEVQNGVTTVYFKSTHLVADGDYLLEVECLNSEGYGSWEQVVRYEIDQTAGPNLAGFWAWTAKSWAWILLGLFTLLILITVFIKVMHGL
jgi:hypothetical protein